jgi:uncharacterized protein YbcC (UPF0753/DUF2309 family)
VEAPATDIDGILARHPSVAELFDNGWLSLYRLDAQGRVAGRRHRGGDWRATGTAAADLPVAAE